MSDPPPSEPPKPVETDATPADSAPGPTDWNVVLRQALGHSRVGLAWFDRQSDNVKAAVLVSVLIGFPLSFLCVWWFVSTYIYYLVGAVLAVGGVFIARWWIAERQKDREFVAELVEDGDAEREVAAPPPAEPAAAAPPPPAPAYALVTCPFCQASIPADNSACCPACSCPLDDPRARGDFILRMRELDIRERELARANPTARPPHVVIHRAPVRQEMRRTLPPKPMTTEAVVTFVLYWLAWIPGLIANLVFLSQARDARRRSGAAPNGMGCLVVQLWLFFWIPLIVVVVLIIATAGSMKH